MKRGIILILIICLLSVSFVSAGFFSDIFDKITGKTITGYAIAEDCTNVVALYHFDGNANDDSGNGNDGINNGATFNTGKLGQGAVFDGVNDYVDAGNDNSLKLNNDFTVSVWVKPESTQEEAQVGIIIGGYYSSPYYGIRYQNSRARFLIYDGTQNPNIPSNLINDGAWHHIVGVRDVGADTLSLYEDGVQISSIEDTTTGSIEFTNSFHIGRDRDSWFNGTIDEVIIYNKVLNSSEVSELYNSGAGVSVSCGGPCTPNPDSVTCGAWVCGTRINNCGQSVSCGTCSANETCSSGVCVPASTGDCDADNDGYDSNNITCSGNDCNDNNNLINPGATEVCTDTTDNDCDNLIDCQDTATCSSHVNCQQQNQQCTQGQITSDCECGGIAYTTGYCCNNIFFDPTYIDNYANVCNRNFLYVDNQNPSCDDATSYALNSESIPWCTLGRATWGSTSRSSPNSGEAAQAGDVVIIKAGTYNAAATGGQRYDPAFNPVNEGTSGNYITFLGVGTVTLQSTNGDGPVIGSLNRDYIKWDNFYIDEANVNTIPSPGPVAVWGGEGGVRVNYVVLENIEIKGAYKAGHSTNHPGIYLFESSNVTIRNCKVYDMDGPSSNNNHLAAVMVYHSDNLLIENNEFYNNGAGINYKDDNEGPVTIRYNLIYGHPMSGILIQGTLGAANPKGTAYQNVIRDNRFGIEWSGYDPPPKDQNGAGPDDFRVVNNNIDNSESGFYIQNYLDCDGFDNDLVQNNILTNSSVYAIRGDGAQCTGFDNTDILFEHNMYYTYGTFARITTTTYTLASWQSTFNQDIGSIITNPQYVDETNDDFHLQTGSPARDRGIDILDLDNDGSTTDSINLGAYITGNEIIGIIDYRATGGTPTYQCSDGIDNDGDGLIDYPADPGCASPTDNDETDVPSESADTNNDGCVDINEIIAFVGRWKNGEVELQNLISEIDSWKNGC